MTQRVALLLVFAAASTYAQAPAVAAGGILNHFSFAAPGMPNGSIAQGSIFDIYGTNIGPAELAQPGGFPLPTQLSGTSVQVTVGGTTVDALLFFVARNQIAALLPSRTPEGNGTLTVTVNGTRSAAAPLTVVARSVGILTLPQTGRGAAVMQLTGTGGEVYLNGVTRPARPGDIGVFYGTGLGRVTFDESRGAPVQNLDGAVQAVVGGQTARIHFQGRTPGLAGLDQVNVEIPAGVSGCSVPVWFQSGSVISNVSTISVAAAGNAQCPDPPQIGGGLSGILKAGSVVMVRTGILLKALNNLEVVTDVASSSFSSTDLALVPVTPQDSPLVQVGNCIVGPIRQQEPSNPSGAEAVTYLDAGASLTIRGPNGTRTLPKLGPEGYSAIVGMTPIPNTPVQPALYFSPGIYTVEVPGGAQVPAFTASLTLPNPAFAWTNIAPTVSITRSAGLEITWSGGDSFGWVDVAASSLLPRVGSQSPGGGYFSCRFPASAGRGRIGPEILLQLPPSYAQANGDHSAAITVAHTIVPTLLPLPGFTVPQFGYVVSDARVAEVK